MSELTLLLLRIGFLVLMWGFVFAVVYALRADMFGVRARRMPEPAAASAGSAPVNTPPATPAVPAPTPSAAAGGKATTKSATRIIITSGPKKGLEIPLGSAALTIGRSSESGLVIRDDYTSTHHARLMLWGEQWMIQDLDSTNGTSHNGAKVTSPTPVLVGAPIKVGATTFELRA